MTTQAMPDGPRSTGSTSDDEAGGIPPYVEPAVDADADVDEEWLTGGPAKGVRVRVPAGLLMLLAVALLGIAGGARLQSAQAATTVGVGAAAGAGAAGVGGFGTGGQGRTGTGQGGTGQGGTGQGGTGQGGAGGGRGGTIGTVQSVSGDTVTLTTAQGQTVTVKIASDTTITKSTDGTVSDIKNGATLVVRGQAAADGTTTAQSITIGGAAGFGGGAGGIPGAGGAGGQGTPVS